MALYERGLAPSRARARSMIEAGCVLVDGRPVTKPSQRVTSDAELRVAQPDHPYVSRGGAKLAGALRALAFDPRGLVVADLGASTGGFTDCVLQRGARRVYAIDVGRDQLHARLRADPRVVVREGVNARHPLQLPEPVQLVLVDASFISLTKLLPTARALLREGGHVLALVKPQFEVGSAHVGKRGVVRDDALRARAVSGVVAAAQRLGLRALGHADSVLTGPEGNQETFVLFVAS